MRLSLVLLLLALPSAARAECRSSPNGLFSYDLRVSPRAGGMCLHIVELHHGAGCAQLTAEIELACNETRRMAVTDRGYLVSVLAPRASEREWSIVRVTVGRDHFVHFRLRELPGIETIRGVV